MGNDAYKKSHLEQGLCVDCSREAAPGYSRCVKHIESQRIMGKKCRMAIDPSVYKAKREKRKAEGKCIRCGNKLGEDSEGHAKCTNCRLETPSDYSTVLRRQKELKAYEANTQSSA